MSEKKQSPVIRPYRADKPSLASPVSHTLPSLLALSNQPTLEQDDIEEEGNSSKTIKSFTSVLPDATTPVVAGTSTTLPPPPDSPSIQLDPPAEAGFTFRNREETRSTFNRQDRRAGSQRNLERKKQNKRINRGIVIGDFNGLYPDELTVRVGEEIEIVSKDTVVSRNIGWWTGRNSKGKIGIFPAACVSCDVQGIGGGISVNSKYPLEIKNSEVELKEVIGLGGFGKVFRAIYRGEEVAVKVAKTTNFDSLKAVQDVMSEAEKFAHLAHVNICALVGVVLVKDVCLILEYARGGALSDILHRSNISLPMDVIMNWTGQIASGMYYLHHEASPTLIHRDLKTSNILLTNTINPSNLKGNVIKITDFGLAREIEHTTHMSGAGTYPWMAPEVIKTSDFSKKSDVWSFAVVLWELVTGERPYGGLNLFVVAYGVGTGTLSLPIPEGCPQPLTTLMDACWRRDHVERPSFEDILMDIKNLEDSEFFSDLSDQEFLTMQSTWRDEIQKKFVELKKMEHELQKREQILQERISEQEQKRRELEEEKREIRKKAEELDRLIRQVYNEKKEEEEVDNDLTAKPHPHKSLSVPDSHQEQQQQQQQLLLRQQQLLQQRQQQKQDVQLVRPPRLRPFSIRRLIRKLWGNESSIKKMDSPLPSKVESIRAIRRITSLGGEEKKQLSKRRATDPSSMDMPGDLSHKMSLVLSNECPIKRHHQRGSSDEYRGADFLSVDTSSENAQPRRGSVPSSPNHNRCQPVIAQQQFFPPQGPSQQVLPNLGTSSLKREMAKKSRQRSWSDLRTDSPHQQLLLPSYISPVKGTASSSSSSSSQPSTSPLSTLVATTSSLPLMKPAHLGLYNNAKNRLPSKDSNSPGSPSVTLTPAEHPLKHFNTTQYDSGKDSLTCSDASGHSNSSETHPMIELDSPMHLPMCRSRLPSAKDNITAEFDPLALRSSISQDSLLYYGSKCTAGGISTSPTPTPVATHRHHRNSMDTTIWMGPVTTSKLSGSESVSPPSSISPKQSLTSKNDSVHPSVSIARPRPKASTKVASMPSKDMMFQTISAPSSRPPSPRTSHDCHWQRGTSPTGSVQSMRALSFDEDFGSMYITDSDNNSTTSSLIDLQANVDEATMINFNFDNMWNIGGHH